jgi:hypothetical protein
MRLSEIFVRGIDTSPIGAPEGGAEDIVNLRWDLNLRAWTNDRALVDLIVPDGTNPFTNKDILSVYAFRPQGNNKQHILFEELQSDGSLTLKVLIGNTTHTLKTDRHIPNSNEPTTQYITYNSVVFIMNGYDTPLVYFGSKYIREVFFDRPSPPSISTPGQSTSQTGMESIGLFARQSRTSSGRVFQFAQDINYGTTIGASAIDYYDGSNQNFYVEGLYVAHEWVVSFITDTGSESAVSARSNTIGILGSGEKIEDDESPKTNARVITSRLGFDIQDIPLGPPGTLKRRLYRSKNQGAGFVGDQVAPGAGSELYFNLDINDNTTTRIADVMPDQNLGSEGPAPFERQPFPNARFGAAYGGRLVLAGVRDDPGAIYISDPGTPEQFSATNTLVISTGYGGDITALYPYNNLLLIFRETAIDALVQTQNGFQVVPVSRNVGSKSQHSIQDVQGLGTMFLGSDRIFYVLQGNLSGGSRIEIINASEKLGTKLLEINEAALEKAFAIYNPYDKEYWCHVPSRGLDLCVDGYVYHTPTGGWSRRTGLPLSGATMLQEGKVAFATRWAYYQQLNGESQVPLGIQVWAGLGENTERLSSYIETPWLSLGQPELLKRINNLLIYTYKNEFSAANYTVYGAVDYKTYARVIANIKAKNSEVSSPGILDTAIADGGDLQTYYNWDQNHYSSRDVITLRCVPNLSSDVGYWDNQTTLLASEIGSAANGGIRWVKFRFANANNNEIRFIGYAIEFNIDGKNYVWNPSDTSSET